MQPRFLSHKKRETLPRRIVLGSLAIGAIMVWLYRKYSLDLQDLVSYLAVSLGLLALIIAVAALPVWLRHLWKKHRSRQAD